MHGTALHVAVRTKSYEVVQLLFKFGVDPFLYDSGHKTVSELVKDDFLMFKLLKNYTAQRLRWTFSFRHDEEKLLNPKLMPKNEYQIYTAQIQAQYRTPKKPRPPKLAVPP